MEIKKFLALAAELEKTSKALVGILGPIMSVFVDDAVLEEPPASEGLSFRAELTTAEDSWSMIVGRYGLYHDKTGSEFDYRSLQAGGHNSMDANAVLIDIQDKAAGAASMRARQLKVRQEAARAELESLKASEVQLAACYHLRPGSSVRFEGEAWRVAEISTTPEGNERITLLHPQGRVDMILIDGDTWPFVQYYFSNAPLNRHVGDITYLPAEEVWLLNQLSPSPVSGEEESS